MGMLFRLNSSTYFIKMVSAPPSLLTPLLRRNRPIFETSFRRSRATSALSGCFSSALKAGNVCSV